MKHLEKISDYEVNIDELKSVYFNVIEKIIEWSKIKNSSAKIEIDPKMFLCLSRKSVFRCLMTR